MTSDWKTKLYTLMEKASNNPSNLNRYYEEAVDNVSQLLTQEREEVVKDFALWWSDKQTQNEEEWLQRQSRSDATRIYTEYLQSLTHRKD